MNENKRFEVAKGTREEMRDDQLTRQNDAASVFGAAHKLGGGRGGGPGPPWVHPFTEAAVFAISG